MITLVVLSEYLGWRRNAPAWEQLARDLFSFALLVIMAIGAILGAGIWLVTSALEPRGIASLLRVFFWPWFTEWFAFAGEVIVILIYHYTWQRWMGPRKLRHIRLGLAYTIFGLASAVLITGILGFMLTPDGWPAGRSFWAGFFNPTFLPQLLLRLSAAYTLGAVFAMTFVLFRRYEASFKKQAIAVFGRIALGGTLAAMVTAAWYFTMVPERFKSSAVFSVLTSNLSQYPALFWVANTLGLVLLLGLGFAALRGRPALAKVLAVPVVICCVVFVSEFERIREFIRGPYIMPGYMYANQVLLSEQVAFNQTGMLPEAYWYHAASGLPDAQAQGAYLFSQNCAACHTVGGINNIASRVQGRTEDGLYVIIGHTQEMVPFMSPFAGTPQEQRILAQYLYQLGKDPLAAGHPSRFLTVPVSGPAGSGQR